MKLENLASSRIRVEEVARSALAPGFAGQPQRVPEALVSALVDGQGARDEVAEITHNAFGGEPPLELVLFDTDQIGGYVFESSRPPVIAGASKILSDLNDSNRGRYPKNIIFSGGGEGILLVPAGEGQRICDEIEQMYRRETIGALGVTTDHLAVSPVAFLAAGRNDASPGSGVELVSGTPAVLARARDRIRRKKDGRLPGTTPVKGGESRCISCRDRAGTVPASELREELSGKLCPPCVKRWRTGRTLIAGVSFEAMVASCAQSDGNSRSKSSYLGFVYADGNAMGALFGR
ncbi:MAG: hypothetical protein GY856_08090, partial [bacterium]|nr:hypothetical protein [bacterium]